MPFELEELLDDVAAELPLPVRKVLRAAEDHGWKLNPPGLTLALRLNHPEDILAQPVYITWQVGRTPTGKLSMKHYSCGTQGLQPLSGKDLLEYLADPSVIYPLDGSVSDSEALSLEGGTEVPCEPLTVLTEVLGAVELVQTSEPSSPVEVPQSKPLLSAGIPSDVPSTKTPKPLAVTIPV